MIIDSGAAFTFEFPVPSTESVTETTAVETSTTENPPANEPADPYKGGNSTFMTCAAELIHLLADPRDWTNLKRCAGYEHHIVLDHLRDLDRHMVEIHRAILRIPPKDRRVGSQTRVTLINLRLFLWEEFQEKCEGFVYKALHKAIVPALIDLRDLSACNDWTGREEYAWITYTPPYENSPYHSPASRLKTCYNCKRDGHVIRECGFEKERRRAHHRNRYQRSKAAHDYARTTQEAISRRSAGIKIPLKFRQADRGKKVRFDETPAGNNSWDDSLIPDWSTPGPDASSWD
ncbi:hypothetical protein CC2G_011654 [Coprinopsis cinerea AmutBmut pab1-1]|nr:hypothetical protein CC2G_011654 [Coprinopsis cinerea AmutBmut pab1-1]